MADKLNKIVEGTINKISQQSIDDNNLYQFEDYPVGGITNEQMTNALTSSQSGFYQTNSVYMCIDGGEGKTYLKNHFYRFNIISWEDVTPQFAGKIEEKTLQELESTTIEDSTLYAIDDYPLGGITQAQMTNALKITQRGFYKVNSVYLCVDGDGTSTYIKNHFYRFSYDETTDTYSWVDTKAGADVDKELSTESENPVANKVITNELNDKVSLTKDEYIGGQKIFKKIPKLGTEKLLPEEYQEVEYIRSEGKTQYIDTGIKSNEIYGFELTLTPISRTSDYNGFMGATYDNFHVAFGPSNTSTFTKIRGTSYVNSLPVDSSNIFTWKCLNNTIQLFKNGESSLTQNFSAGALGTTSTNIYIFRCASGNTGITDIKLYSFKLYNQSGELVRDFIPCYTKQAITNNEVNYEANTIGLYDTVNNIFYSNNGTGKFTIGKPIYQGVDLATVDELKEKVSLTQDEIIGGQKIFKKRPQVGEVRLPSEFTEVEYIESTETQYIDTGVKFGTGFACDIKFNMLSTSGDIDLLSSSQNDNYLLVSYLNGTPRIYLNGSASKNITMPYNAIHTVNMNYNGTTLTYKVDDTTNYTLSASNLVPNSNLLLFARSATYGFSKAILYYCKIYNNNTLIRDFVPCYTNQQVTNNNVTYEANTIGLYDIVNNIFYINSGTGTFIKGQNILAGEYIALQSELPIANEENTTDELSSLKVGNINYSVSRVNANPASQASEILSKVEINGTNYKIDYSPYKITNITIDSDNIYLTIE